MRCFFPAMFHSLTRWSCAIALLLIVLAAPAWSVTFTINGVDETRIKENIRLHLNNLKVEPALLVDPFWQDELKAVVSKAVEPYGYYNSNTDISVVDGENVVLAVSLDTPLTVSHVTREIIGAGRDDPAFRAKFNAFPLSKGDVLVQPVYETFKSAMFNYALSNGYFDYYWQATRLDLVREQREANILLIAQSGPRYRFGKLRIIGEDKSLPILERLRTFEEGEPYTAAKLTAFNRELNQSGYFTRVIARPVVSDADGLNVPIEVSVQHRPRDTFDVGVGAATDTGPRIRLGWDRPWVNSRGHSVSADLFLSAPEQSVAADYRIPMKNITHDYLSFQAGYQFVEYSNTATESETLSLSAHRYWQKQASPWQQDASVTYLREDYLQGLNPRTTTTLIMPGYGIRYRQKDNDLSIDNGEYIALLAQVGRDNLGSDINILKGVAEGAFIRTFNDVHRISLRGELGAIKTSDFDRVPASIRFFAGGDRSIRGFAYRDIAPKDTIINPATGETSLDPIGGKYLTTASIEYAYRFADNWRIAAFTDAGTASDSLSADFSYGVGTGVHWLSPIGPVRIYIARGFPADGDKTWRLHLILGPEIL
ncbi:autotransporter assembly complex protein TamA [Alteromonas sp. CYL-A6]|uniref:autotransporter assembly complex protein TamA n=1 Tax=Alteromonas nitratireducens TaxID=3390813 RepID=UPI0034B52152